MLSERLLSMVLAMFWEPPHFQEIPRSLGAPPPSLSLWGMPSGIHLAWGDPQAFGIPPPGDPHVLGIRSLGVSGQVSESVNFPVQILIQKLAFGAPGLQVQISGFWPGV